MRNKSNSHSYSAIEQAQTELRDAIAQSKDLAARTEALLSRCRGPNGKDPSPAGSQLHG